jgi:predicted metal-binding protein
MTIQQNLAGLVQTAIHLGASDADFIAPVDIVVEDALADLCSEDPGCEQYGLAPSCPPHVPGPESFRQWQQYSQGAVVIRIDIPTSALFSDERRGIMQLLHEVAAGVEQKAVEMGYTGSKAFAGGSCKKIFCFDQPDCPVLTDQKDCRYPQSARPSMSGFGINVARLMHTAGWPAEKASPDQVSDADSMTWVAGLILIQGPINPSPAKGSQDK